jgi:hypothetical protein
VYIDGKPRRAGYICGFKKDAEHKGNVGFGTDLVRGLCRDNVDFFYCSVVTENSETKKKFWKKRSIFSMKALCRYKTYIINPKVKMKKSSHSFSFRKATKADEKILLEFLQKEGMKKDLFPVFENFESFDNLCVENFYILSDENGIVAAGALWNRTDCKQYIVKRYGKIMKLARIFNPVLSLLGYIKLPRENEPLDFPMLSFVLCRDDNKEYFRTFLNDVKEEVQKNHGIFVIGLPESHFASDVIKGIKSINFETEICEIRFPWKEREYAEINSNKIFPECALL